jgi:hypothetical protein
MLAERMYFYGKLKNVFLRTNTLVRDSRGRAVIPSLKKVQETCRGYRLILVLPDGMVPDQVQDVVNHIAYACRCPDVRFDVRDEKVILYFNYRKLPDLVGRCVIQYQSEQKEMQVAYISRERIWELAHGNN